MTVRGKKSVMRRWIGIVGLIVVIVIAAWAWPLAGALQLARAAQAGDGTAVMEHVDVGALRRSLARQIAVGYLAATGKTQKLGDFGRSVANSAATTVADPYVEQLLTPDNLTALLAHGRINRVTLGGQTVAVKGEIPNLSSAAGSNILATITSSYYDGLNDFLILVDGGHGADDVYGVHMRRSGLAWRLGGLDLPRPLVTEMARSVQAGQAQAAP